jgi:hypothetical protein
MHTSKMPHRGQLCCHFMVYSYKMHTTNARSDLREWGVGAAPDGRKRMEAGRARAGGGGLTRGGSGARGASCRDGPPGLEELSAAGWALGPPEQQFAAAAAGRCSAAPSHAQGRQPRGHTATVVRARGDEVPGIGALGVPQGGVRGVEGGSAQRMAITAAGSPRPRTQRRHRTCWA